MKRLYDLETSEVSLVPLGANKRKFLVFKSRQQQSQTQGERTMHAQLMKLLRKGDAKASAIASRVLKELKDGPEPKKGENDHADPAPVNPMSEHEEAAVKAIARIAHPMKDKEAFKSALHKALKALGLHHGDGDGDEDDLGNEEFEKEIAYPERMEGEQDGVLKEHHDQAMAAAKAAYKAHIGKLGAPKYPDAVMAQKSKEDCGDGEEETMEKSAVMKSDGTLDLSAVPASVRPAVEAIFKGQQEAVKKAAELETQLKAERDLRRKKEFVAKAAGLKHFAGDREELAQTLMDLEASSPKLFESTWKQLETTDRQAEQVSKGMFQEMGSSRVSAQSGSAEQKIEMAVKGIVEKSTGKTYHQAYDEFLQTPEGKRLYNDQTREHEALIRQVEG